MSDCQVYKLTRDPSAVRTVNEGEQTVAFLDIEPAIRGQTLVVPKHHDAELTEMEEAGTLFQTVHRVATALKSAFEPDGINVVQSNGATAGQEISHPHVHVISRSEDDVMFDWVTEATQEETARTIREEFDVPS